MEQLVAQFPKQIADAIEIAQQAELTFYKNKSFKNLIICGMGGSGIGGKIVSQLFEDQSKFPVILVQDYDLPAFVDEFSLVIGSSYSGMTEETLSALYEAKDRGATIVGISSGGDLIQWCVENNYDYIRVPGGNPPRSMLAFSMIQLIKILGVSGIVKGDTFELLKKCRQLLNTELMTIKAEAKKLAEHFYQKQGIIYTDTIREGIAIRARQQFNENSKQLVWHHVVPEMNHNELVGWGGGKENFAVLFLASQFLSERNLLRFELSKDIIRQKTQHILVIEGRGASRLEEYFYFIHIVDWASVFLSELNQQDAMEIRAIDYLKNNLNKA